MSEDDFTCILCNCVYSKAYESSEEGLCMCCAGEDDE